MDAVTNIYEASAFQDITGQRITKIVRALQSHRGQARLADQRLRPAGETAGGRKAAKAMPRCSTARSWQKTAASQTDIDALFDSLG